MYIHTYIHTYIYTLPRVGNNIGVEDIRAEADEPKGVDLVVE
jgi:hypothetical protein